MSECMTQEDAERMDNEQAVAILKPLRDMMRDQYGCPISDAYFALDKAITALLQPKRIKGRWIGYAGTIGAECSECHKWIDVIQGTAEMNYCPNCGAEMETE